MNIAITGATGLLGRALAKSLRSRGHSITGIARTSRPGNESVLLWDPELGTIAGAGIVVLVAVFHLGGESSAYGGWNP
jgi:uncharacterized protein